MPFGGGERMRPYNCGEPPPEGGGVPYVPVRRTHKSVCLLHEVVALVSLTCFDTVGVAGDTVRAAFFGELHQSEAAIIA